MKKRKYPKIGSRFRSLRAELDTDEKECTQDALTKLIGVLKPQISELENGKRYPSINELMVYSKHFNVPMEYLLGMSDSRCYTNINVVKELGLSDEAISHLKENLQSQVKYNLDLSADVEVINLLLSNKSGQDLLKYIHGFLFFKPNTFETTGGTPSKNVLVRDLSDNPMLIFIDDVESFLIVDIQKQLGKIKEYIKNKETEGA